MNQSTSIRETVQKTRPSEPRLVNTILTGGLRTKLFWLLRPLDNWFFGLLFTLFYRQYRTDGLTFDYPQHLVSLGFRSQFLCNIYELGERTLVRKYIRPHDHVLELGACLGIVSCLTNKILKAKSRHVVVEANPYLLPFLFANRAQNRCNFLVEFGVVALTKTASFFAGETILGGRCDVEQNGNAMAQHKIDVVSRNLTEFHQKHGAFTILIMDIEGGEYDFLKAFCEELSSYRLIIVEMHDRLLDKWKLAECESLIKGAGFSLVESIFNTHVYARDNASGMQSEI